MIHIDFHCHTIASPDGGLTQADISHKLESDALHVVAVTDHNTVDEAARLQSVFGSEKIIVGEEIMTPVGEIIGLYLTETVPPGLSPVETVERIKAQGGLVYIPHPFEKARSGIQLADLESIRADVDLIEVINGRSFSKKAQRQAREWAAQHHVAGVAASDAHGRIGWGNVYTTLSAQPIKETLVTLAAHATLNGTSNGYYSYLYPKLNRLRKKTR